MNESRPPKESDTAEAEEGSRPSDEGQDASGETEATAASSAAEPGDGAAGPDPPGSDDRGSPTTAGPPPNAKSSRVPLGIAVLAVLAAIGVGVFAAQLAERLDALEEELAAVPADRDSALEELAAEMEERDVRAEVSDLAERVTAETQAREALGSGLEDRLEAEVADLRTALADVRELAAGHHTRWRLAEVRYLAGVAHQRLQLAGDTDGAIAALEAADEALHRLGDARLLGLRDAIVEDIERIRAVDKADVEGIALRLLRLERAVEQLPLVAAEDVPRVPDTRVEVDPDDPLWQQLVDRLRGLVVVRHREAEVDVPEAAVELDGDTLPPREALGLMLRQARTTALNGDAAGYERAMTAAIAIVADHFDGEAAAVERFASRLAELAGRPVRADVPDLRPTLDRVADVTRELEAERNRRGRERDNDGEAQ